MLELEPDDLMSWAARAYSETESVLRGWASFDERADSNRNGGGPLSGIPVGVKDVIDVAGMPTRAGSRAREEQLPVERDAEVVARLREKGALICGKTATTEFAYLDPSNATNPFNAAHTPGGSSSGSAAVVGAGVVPLALGTQTAGSVCRPAAWCGTYAFKPSTGSTPSAGVEPFAPSFDTVGVFGLDLVQVIHAARAIIGEDDPVQTSKRMPSVVWLEDQYFTDVSPECLQHVERARALLAAAGCDIRPVRTGLDFAALRDVHRIVMQYEAYVHHGALLDTAADRIGPHWKGALELGSKRSVDEVTGAMTTLTEARSKMEAAIGEADLVLGPPVRTAAPEGINSTGDAGLIIPWTYAGVPITVLPTGLSTTGLPLAVMLTGRRGQDRKAMADSLAVSSILRGGGLRIED